MRKSNLGGVISKGIFSLGAKQRSQFAWPLLWKNPMCGEMDILGVPNPLDPFAGKGL